MGDYKKYFTQAVRKTYRNNSDFLIAETNKNFTVVSNDTNFALNSANPID